MSTGIKNGKDHTFNICIIILFLLLAVVPVVSSSALKNDDEKRRVIVIDAGHGGKDPGALGSMSREKDITLAIALKTGEYIQQNIKNVTVIYTRKDDSTVELRDRPKVANKANADLFISIHANWAKSKSVMGAETYVMGPAKDQANLEVAMNENSVMLREADYLTKYEGFDPKSSESYIMFSLTQKVYQEQSTDLATRIQKQFRERVNRNDRDVKQAGFWVLFNTKMPSVLVETGFITNPSEEKYLISKEGQNYLASSIYRACRDYLYSIDSRSAISYPDQSIEQDSDRNQVKVQEQGPLQIQEKEMKPDTLKDGGQIPDDIIFMVQIKTSTGKTEIKPDNFKGLGDIVEINAPGRFKYASGNFSDYSDAVNYRMKMKTLFPDAFVIAVQKNKILPLQQALEQIEKQKKVLDEKDLK
jgi:N-acetylmuramoyl-L-alanine amidase